MIIIGIDPGTAHTGFGIVRAKKKRERGKSNLKCLGYGIIETKRGLPPEQRLKKIHLELSKLLNRYKPDVLAVENIYFFKNLKTAIPVSEAKGVILLTAAKKKIKVGELAPLEVKMGICGYGRADKEQIQRMVKEILTLKEVPKPDDAADALAIAVCYAFKKPQRA